MAEHLQSGMPAQDGNTILKTIVTNLNPFKTLGKILHD